MSYVCCGVSALKDVAAAFPTPPGSTPSSAGSPCTSGVESDSESSPPSSPGALQNIGETVIDS